jgi:Phytochelatin synthase
MKKIFIFMFLSFHALAIDFIPKYGPLEKPRAILLRQSYEYLKKSSASDFWALIPYYSGMRTGHSASAASVAMILNALRKDKKFSSSDELISESDLLKKVTTENWAKQLKGKKPKGVNILQLQKIITAALSIYDIKNKKVELGSKSEDIRKKLLENEESDQNFILCRYLQSAFTDDPEGAVGTYSVVAAFDSAKDLVLILETDRAYYEPYWVSLETFMNGISQAEGGLIWIH